MKKNILITGSAGFIGSYCYKKFLDENYNVFCISTKYDPFIKKKNFLKKTFNAKTIKSFIHRNKINYVLLSHGSINHTESFNKIFKDHFLFTKLIIESLNLKYFQKLIFLSSGDEYGYSKKIPVKESLNCKPSTNYAIVKNLTTNYLLYYFKDTDVSVIILRLFLIYGDGQKSPRLIPLIKHNILNNFIFYANSINQKKDFCHISDLYNALKKILKSQKKVQDVFNFGSGYVLSIKQVIKLVEKKYKQKLILKINENNKIKNSFSFYPNTSKFQITFGFKKFKKMSTNLI